MVCQCLQIFNNFRVALLKYMALVLILNYCHLVDLSIVIVGECFVVINLRISRLGMKKNM